MFNLFRFNMLNSFRLAFPIHFGLNFRFVFAINPALFAASFCHEFPLRSALDSRAIWRYALPWIPTPFWLKFPRQLPLYFAMKSCSGLSQIQTCACGHEYCSFPNPSTFFYPDYLSLVEEQMRLYFKRLRKTWINYFEIRIFEYFF